MSRKISDDTIISDAHVRSSCGGRRVPFIIDQTQLFAVARTSQTFRLSVALHALFVADLRWQQCSTTKVDCPYDLSFKVSLVRTIGK